MPTRSQVTKFERMILPHVEAAYNLARWLTRNDHDAEDVMQEAFLRAFKFFEGFQGMNGRVWLLKIVRNTGYSWLSRNRAQQGLPLEENTLVSEEKGLNPEEKLIQNANGEILRKALEALPSEFREVVVLSDLEGLHYKEISEVAGISLGTVMSRLARGREKLRQTLAKRIDKES